MRRPFSRRGSMILTVLLCSLLITKSTSFVRHVREMRKLYAFSTVTREHNAVRPGAWEKTRLNLFSVKFDSDNGDQNDVEDEQEELDFSAWTRALRSWPLYPTKSPELQQENEPPSKLNSKVSVPLANLINVEALLMASGAETIENFEDMEQFEFGNITLKSNSLGFSTNQTKASSPLSILPSFEQLGNWDRLMGTLQRSITELTVPNTIVTETLLKEATALIEDFVSEASLAVSPSTVQDLIMRASQTLDIQENANNFVLTAEKIARQQGLDVSEAADRARETTKYTTKLVKLANGVLVSGYVAGDKMSRTKVLPDASIENSDAVSRPLFHEYKSVTAISSSEYASVIEKGAEMGDLSGAIYVDTIPRTTKELGHSIVANGTTSDVSWMVTDSLAYEDEFVSPPEADRKERTQVMVRTITVRGFDASDESVDREKLLNSICTASPATLLGMEVHSGLLSIAKDIYKDVERYIDQTAPSHRIVLNGHSVGGSLATLLLLLLTEKRGADYVKQKVLRVFTFGSPPIVKVPDTPLSLDRVFRCSVLEKIGLPDSIVYGYVQPWDPIIRLFSCVDPLYPLLDDIGDDGVTLYASGPQRSLRPITRAILESWEGWPRFRDTFRSTVDQNYTSVGIQHLLLPDRGRYLSDRLVSVNVGVPPVDTVVRISSREMLPALKEMFPLDVFRISFVPAAIRSFAHHFFPAYGLPFVDFAKKKKRWGKAKDSSKVVLSSKQSEKIGVETNGKTVPPSSKSKDWAGAAAQWILGGNEI